MYRMLVDWNEASSTWDSLNAGVTPDGVEATAAAVANWNPNGTVPFTREIDVTSSLQAWQGGAPNYGWAILSTGTDGYRIDPSEHPTPDNRPTLIVEFTRPPDTTLGIGSNTPATASANERGSFSITWVVTGNNAAFRWQKLVSGVFQDIAGEAGQTYTDSLALPSDNGSYRSIACNTINCVTSAVTVVTVTPDTLRPSVALAGVGADQTTLILRFDENVTSAGTYTISPDVGVISATLGADNRTVTVVTGPRTFRTSYTLNASGVQDTAETPNTMTTTNIVFEQDSMVIAGFMEEWKYELGTQDGAAWMSPDTGVYDDTLWSAGNGLFGTETTAATVAMLAAQGLSIQTAVPVQSTVYFRKRVNVAIPTDDIVFEMHHYLDDGARAYANGTEAWRMGFTNGQVIEFATFSAGATGPGTEATLLTNTVPLVSGDNLLAVEVHQVNATSTDLVFGAQIVAVHRIIGPTLTITQSGANVTVSWAPAVGQLEESTDLVNWSNSSRANGLPAPPSGGARFYRVRR
jgi:hypothetical protein